MPPLLIADAAPVLPRAPAKNAEIITIKSVGDIMLGSTFPEGVPLPPEDGALMLKDVAPILADADLTFGNLEGPMTEGGVSTKCGDRANCYAFRVPPRYGKYLKDAGFDVMTLANNHAMDFGAAGRESSKRTLDSLGILHTGEIGDIAHLNIKGKRIALIGFSTYKHSYNLNELDAAKSVVAKLKRENDLVIVTFHGGAEGTGAQHVPYTTEIYLGENRGDLRKFTHAMVDAGADLIVGHGPHVVRGMEIYRRKLIAYSLGNFATWRLIKVEGVLGVTCILEVKLAPNGDFAGGRIVPVKQDRPGGAYLDKTNAVIPIMRALSQQDFGANAVNIGDDGTLLMSQSKK
ncbi:MAG: CapA family protein [Pyrinomonadaceae bacterium]